MDCAVASLATADLRSHIAVMVARASAAVVEAEEEEVVVVEQEEV